MKKIGINQEVSYGVSRLFSEAKIISATQRIAGFPFLGENPTHMLHGEDTLQHSFIVRITRILTYFNSIIFWVWMKVPA